MAKKKAKEECFTLAKIKIEKVVEWQPNGLGEKRKDLLWIASIKGYPTKEWTTSFNARSKREFWKRLKEEIHL